MNESQSQERTLETETRVSREVEQLAEEAPTARDLSGWMAGTSEETAALFASRHVVP